MKNKTVKIVIIVIASILCAVLIGFGAYYAFPVKLQQESFAVTPLANTVRLFEADGIKSLQKVNADGTPSTEQFKILALTDLHLDGGRETNEVTLRMLIANIERAKPDLVVFVGDLVTAANNRSRAVELCELMERTNVYWTTVLGNHEGDNALSISRSKFVEIYDSYEHCLVDSSARFTADGAQVFGNNNQQINILNASGDIAQTLFMLDGGNEISSADARQYNVKKGGYDYVKPSQIQWYSESVSKLPAGTSSMVFVHIPLPEFNTAYAIATEQGIAYGVPRADGTVLMEGEKRERVCASDYNSGLFEAIVSGGSTRAVVSGHDHVNDYRVLYRGVNLCYCRSSGYGSYNVITSGKGDKLIQGASTYTIAADGTISYGTIVNTDYFDQSDIMYLYE